MITEVGQQRSRMTKLIITIAGKFLTNKKIQLAILKFGDLVQQIGSLVLHSLTEMEVNRGKKPEIWDSSQKAGGLGSPSSWVVDALR